MILSFVTKAMTAAVASTLIAGAANAAGLGKLTVLSALGQPLRAEIELTAVGADEVDGLTAKLAPVAAFKQANIEFNPALMTLHFEVAQKSGHQILQITSSQPISEPFVDMLLELSWGSGRLVREYTFLLDPPELRSSQSAPVAPVDRGGSRATPSAAASAAPAGTAPAPASAAARHSAASAAGAGAGAAQYQVKRGDTLGKVAGQLKPSEVSLDMMLVALYRANPDAFVGHNMNRLKAGTILAVPDADTVKAVGEGEAHSVVVAQAADFNSYRNKLAGQVAAADASSAPAASQSAAGKITARVQERPTAVNAAPDQLKLSRAHPSASAAGGKAAAEDRFAKEQALADATTRVKELEKNVNELEKLLALKSKNAASAAAKAPAAAPAAAPAPAVAARPPAPAMSAPGSAPAVAPAAAAPVVAAAAPAPAVKPPVHHPVKLAPVPAAPSLFDTIKENALYIGAGVLALLLAAGAVIMRRRRDAAPHSIPEPATTSTPSEVAHSLFAHTGGQSVDTNNSVFNSNFAPSASQLDTNEVDPVAEADVYIAYGRDAQAEEILKEALRTHPERIPVRLKLLEIYAARKDQRAFEAQATEVYTMTKGAGEEWAQAAALGLSIDPLNPLYAGAGAAAAPASAEERDQQAMLAQELENVLAAAPADEPAAPAPSAAPAAAHEEDHSLDFDLGGLSFEPVSADAAPATAPAAADPVMNFDLDATAVPAAAPAPAAPEPDMAFDLAFDTPAAAPAAAAGAAPLSAPEIESRIDDLNFDLTAAPAPAAAEPHPMADLAKAFELSAVPEPTPAVAAEPMPDLSMDFGTPAPAPAPQAEPADAMLALDLPAAALEAAPVAEPAGFDLSGIDLDLPGTKEEAGGASAGSPAHMEMETKLDLAIAYQEIGDKEGARELIDEVIKGGSPDQVAKANSMRAQLA